MTQSEINEGSKVIAEFMGMYDYSNDNEFFTEGRYFCYAEKEMNPGSGYFDMQNCFNTSYDWLMKAWVKFRDLDITNPFNDFIKHKSLCGQIGQTILYSEITEAFSKLVEAINWYNSTKEGGK